PRTTPKLPRPDAPTNHTLPLHDALPISLARNAPRPWFPSPASTTPGFIVLRETLMNRWGKISFSVLSALAAVACTATVAPVNGPVAPIAPSIATQPTNQTVTAGQTATFTVMA